MSNRVAKGANGCAEASGRNLYFFWQFPESGQLWLPGRALPQEDRFTALDEQDGAGETKGGPAAPLHGKLLLDAGRPGLAAGGYRAVRTCGPPRKADGRAQFHQRLIEIARPPHVEQPFRGFLKPVAGHLSLHVSGLASDSREHAHHVAVEHRVGQTEGDAGDGGGRVVPDAGERADRSPPLPLPPWRRSRR